MEQQNGPHINLYDQGPVGPNDPKHAPGAGYVSDAAVMAYVLDDGPMVCPTCHAEGLGEFYSPRQVANAVALTSKTYPWDEKPQSCDCCSEGLEPEPVEGY